MESAGNKVTHLDPSTDTFQQWTIPTPNSNPTGLALTMMSGSLALFGTESAKNKVFVFFPGTGTFREYTLPTPDWSPQFISIEPGATEIKACFTALKGSQIGEVVYNPDSGTARLYGLTLPLVGYVITDCYLVMNNNPLESGVVYDFIVQNLRVRDLDDLVFDRPDLCEHNVDLHDISVGAATNFIPKR